MKRFLTPPSPAERTLLLAYMGLAACGAMLGSEALSGLQGLVDVIGEGVALWVLALASAGGACISGYLLRDRFGFVGRMGFTKACFGSVLATLALGVAAGTLVLPIFGTMFGPWLLVLTIATKPWMALPWLAALYGFHLAFISYRNERKTIYRHVERIDGELT